MWVVVADRLSSSITRGNEILFTALLAYFNFCRKSSLRWVIFVFTNRALANLLKLFIRYQVLQVTVKHRSQLETLIKLHETDPELDFWTEPRTSRPIDIMVPPHRFDDIVDLITSKDMDYTIKIDDVQK